MGTNYDLHYPECTQCRRTPEPLHICKNYCLFEGHFKWKDGEPEPWLTSWQEWKAYLTEQTTSDGPNGPAVIRDEYGCNVALDDFIARVEATPDPGRRKQYDFMVEEYPSSIGIEPQLDEIKPGYDWVDAENFSFHGGAFC